MSRRTTSVSPARGSSTRAKSRSRARATSPARPRAASRSRGRKETTEESQPERRSARKSTTQKAGDVEEVEEDSRKKPVKKSTNKKAKKDEEDEEDKPAKKSTNKKSKKDEEDEESAKKPVRKSTAKKDVKKAEEEVKPSARRSRGRQPREEEDDEEVEVKPLKIRTRSRSAARRNTELSPLASTGADYALSRASDELESLNKHLSAIAPASPVSSPLRDAAEDSSDDEGEVGVFSPKEAQVHVDAGILPYVCTTVVLSFAASLIVLLALSKPTADVLISYCSSLSCLVKFAQFNNIELTIIATTLFSVATLVLQRWAKCQHSPKADRYASLEARGVIALFTFLAYLQLVNVSSSHVHTAIVLLILSLSASVSDLVLTMKTSTLAKKLELSLTVVVCVYTLFFTTASHIAAAEHLYRFLVPVLVTRAISTMLLSRGHCGILSSDNNSISARAFTAAAHATSWLYLIVHVLAPIYIFYCDFISVDTVLASKELTIAAGSSLSILIAGSLLHYADSLALI